MDTHELFLTLSGIPRSTPDPSGAPTYFRDLEGAWRPYAGDHLAEIEAECVQLHDVLAAAIFGSRTAYYEILPKTPAFVSEAGLNSESTLSRVEFEQALSESSQIPRLYELLYLYDCRKLVSGIQESSKELSILVGEFYRILNLEPLFAPEMDCPDGIRWITCPAVTLLTTMLSSVYIKLHSLLDYVSKLAFEGAGLHREFASYPKLRSSGMQFGSRLKIGWKDLEGTLFDFDGPMTEVELIRNFVVHDGLLDDMPKVYVIVQDRVIAEKFLLLPDRTESRFDRVKNRCLFYSREDKVNQRLPKMIEQFQARLVATLRRIQLDILGSDSPKVTQDVD
jgi:hypothetical protein